VANIITGSSIYEAISNLGFDPPNNIEPGRWVRFSTNGKARDDAGSCKLFDDSDGGVINDFRTNQTFLWFPNATETRRTAPTMRAVQAKPADQDERRHKEARQRARHVLSVATPAAGDHPYLVRKQVGADGLREISADKLIGLLGWQAKAKGEPLTGRLLVAAVGVGDRVTTVELIDETGLKSAMFGGQKAGAYWCHGLPEGDGVGSTIVIGEGIATVKTAADLTGWLPVAALTCGNLEAVAVALRERYSAARLVVVADVGNGQAKAEEAAQAVGADLVVPVMPAGATGTDINDVAVFDREAARWQLVGAVSNQYSAPPERVRADLSCFPTVNEARASTDSAFHAFLAAVSAYKLAVTVHKQAVALRKAGKPSPFGNVVSYFAPDPPVHAIGSAVEMAQAAPVIGLICDLIAAYPTKKVVVLVRSLSRVREAAAAIAAAGFRTVAMSEPDDERPDGRGPMCLDTEAVGDAANSVESIHRSVCQIMKDGVQLLCHRYDECPVQALRKDARQAEVIVMKQSQIFQELPDYVENVSALIIEGDLVNRGIDKEAVKIQCSMLKLHRLDVRRNNGEHDIKGTNDLLNANEKLSKAIEACQAGNLTAAAVREAGITAEMAQRAFGLAMNAKKSSGIIPGMKRKDRKQRRDNVESHNKFVKRCHRMWEIVDDMLTNDKSETAFIKCEENNEVGTCPGAKLRARKHVRDGWLNYPTLLIGSTMKEKFVRPYYPWAKIVEVPYPMTPNATVNQYHGAPVSLHKLSQEHCHSAKDRTTANNHITNFVRYIEIKATQYKQCVIVCPKDVESDLIAHDLPSNVRTDHYNAVGNKDRWKGVDYCLFIASNTASPGEVEVLAEALSGRPVIKVEGFYPRDQFGRDHHPDELCEEIRKSICNDAILEIVGAVQAVNREEGNPVVIEVCNGAALPIPVDRVDDWAPPSAFDVMVARGAVLENASDMSLAFPDLWKTPKAAEHDRARRTPPNALYQRIYKAFGGVLVTYQPVGAGMKARVARFDVGVIADPKSWLEAKIGLLARFEVVAQVADKIETDIVALEQPQPEADIVAPALKLRRCSASIFSAVAEEVAEIAANVGGWRVDGVVPASWYERVGDEAVLEDWGT